MKMPGVFFFSHIPVADSIVWAITLFLPAGHPVAIVQIIASGMAGILIVGHQAAAI